MTIVPVNGTILVQQPCALLGKTYERAFEDTKQGFKDAVAWAFAVVPGWADECDADWEVKFGKRR